MTGAADDPGDAHGIVIRRARADDAEAIADVYLASFHATYDFPLAHADDEVRGWIRDVLVADAETWVATDGDDAVVGLMVAGPDDLDQLYVAPDRLGQGIGRQLLDRAKERSPDGLTLYTFQVNDRARRFYERNGFVATWFGDGAANEEGQPDVRYVWRPGGATPAGDPPPDREVLAPDGVRIAVYTAGSPTGRPIVLVHGATADHTTWRTSGPLLGARHPLHEIDRRGRGASSDGPPDQPYAIEREFDDLAAVVDAIAAESGGPVDVIGHSYGGRIGLGAALRTANLRRLVCYEGAPPALGGRGYQPDDGTLERVAALVADGDRDAALATFMTEIVGMPAADLAAFRADPIWPRRAAAIDTTIRELRAETSPAGSLATLGAMRQPVLQVLGGDSTGAFGEATQALDARLRNGRVITIPGARHAAHHSQGPAFVAAIEAFLGDADVAD